MAKSATTTAKATVTAFQETPKASLSPSPQACKRTYPFAKTASAPTSSAASINCD